MDTEEFRRRGKEMVDYIADYMDTIRDRPVYPNVKPGYLQDVLPDQAPQEGEQWVDIMKDVDNVIMPGVVHWHHPQFHAYFAAGNSYPSIMADMFTDAIGNIGFSWGSSPVCTELESLTMDWLGKMIHLPEEFLASGSSGKGGGVIQGTASETTATVLLAAKSKVIRSLKDKNPSLKTEDIIGRLVAYCSDQAHSSVVKASLVGAVLMVQVESDERQSMKPEALERAIEEDILNGRIPFFCCATLGSTNTCAFDDLTKIGPICNKQGIWLHIDAAYAGSAFICPEFRPLLNGVEFADTFNFNPHKWLLVNFDCSALWIKESRHLVEAFHTDPLYLRHAQQGKVIDYTNWQIPTGKRFRSLKLWFVLRSYGVVGLQKYIRKHVELAHEFKEYVQSDERFEIIGEVSMGLVCFRIKGPNEPNKILHQDINKDGRIHLVPSEINDVYFIRFAICSSRTESKDIRFAWDVITELTSSLISCNGTNGYDCETESCVNGSSEGCSIR